MEIYQLMDLDTGNRYGFWCKGHSAPVEFARETLTQWDVQPSFNEIKQMFARWIPYNSEYGPGMLHYPSRPGQGAFPVTIWEPGYKGLRQAEGLS